MGLLEKIECFCIENSLINRGDRIVIGVSGGPDSLCLLNILNCLKEKYELKLTVVHINHCLRKEADFEENFVKIFSEKLGLEFYSKRVEIDKLKENDDRTTEEIARDVRYTFFNEILERINANKIAVAHNKNDNAETILMNIIRGCGTEGLTGISELNGKIIRPLIETSREEIEKYCEENSLTPMIDKTNFETVYTRNKVRNILIPILKKINPEFIQSLSRFSKIIKDDEEFINDYIDEIYHTMVKCDNGKVIVQKDKFNELKAGVKRRILRKALFEFRGSLKDVGFSTIENSIKEIKVAQNGNIIRVTDDVKILVNYNSLEFLNKLEKIEDYTYELKIPGMTYLKEINKWIKAEIKNAEEVEISEKDRNKHFFDIAKTGKKLYVRNRKNGDYFYPTGMEGKKKLKDFFSDMKINTFERNKVPILTNDEEVIWVVGLRSSKKFLKDKSTKEVIIINYGENI